LIERRSQPTQIMRTRNDEQGKKSVFCELFQVLKKLFSLAF